MQYRDILNQCNSLYHRRLLLVSSYTSQSHYINDNDQVISIRESDGDFYTVELTIDEAIEVFRTNPTVSVYGIITVYIWNILDHVTERVIV